ARRELVTVSARDRAALSDLVDRVGHHLARGADPAPACHTLRLGRAHLPHRVAATGADAAELADNLRAALAAAPPPAATAGRTVTLRLGRDRRALADAVRSLADALPGLDLASPDTDPAAALAGALTGLGVRTAAEPADTDAYAAALVWDDREHPLLAVGPDPARPFLDALAALYTAGADLDLSALSPDGVSFD
ncbi:CurL C-terminal domain-containing protein, partial [Nocardiopsis lucentensis]